MLKRLGRILRSPPGERNFKYLAFRPNSPSPVRPPSLKTCEMLCLRSGPSPGLSFLCLCISDVCFFLCVCVDVCLRSCGMDSFNYFILVQTLIWREAAYWLWKKAGWLKQPNWCVKNEKNKQEEKKQQLFLRSQRPPSARSLVIIQNLLRNTCELVWELFLLH